jgi:hypothetical protein
VRADCWAGAFAAKRYFRSIVKKNDEKVTDAVTNAIKFYINFKKE